MTRIQNKGYQRNFMLAMAAYLIVVLLVWPLARTTLSLPLKVLYALAPILPLGFAIWFMARRIFFSDELEQRTHLVGLGVASVVVALFSLVGGFLATAKLLSLEACANLLLWIFPVLMMSYGLARWWVARHYGIDAGCSDEDEAFPAYLRLLSAAGLLAICAVWGYFKSIDGFHLGLLSGMCAGLATAGALMGLLRWRRRRASQQ
ncbi:MAG: hypothetical protein WBV39_10195 [Rudaea sp.]